MTPKEALEIIYSYQSWDCYNDEPNLLSDVELEALNVLKNALTELEELKRYPTSDEVCEALSECEDLDKHSFITYIPEDKSFTLFKQFRADDCYETDLVRYEQGTIYIANYYSPSIITLIGRFYEGMEEK